VAIPDALREGGLLMKWHLQESGGNLNGLEPPILSTLLPGVNLTSLASYFITDQVEPSFSNNEHIFFISKHVNLWLKYLRSPLTLFLYYLTYTLSNKNQAA